MQPAMYTSFLIRLWRDQPEGDWQGEIEHIQSGNSWRFRSLDAVLHFLRVFVEEAQTVQQTTDVPLLQ